MAIDLSLVQQAAEAVRLNVGRVNVGGTRAIELLLVAALTEGHVLIEDGTGIGKTTLAKALALTRGQARQPRQTPQSFLPNLDQLWPDEVRGLSELTEGVHCRWLWSGVACRGALRGVEEGLGPPELGRTPSSQHRPAMILSRRDAQAACQYLCRI
jgi:hypothetical protein